jgi:histidinol dehydrogenase
MITKAQDWKRQTLAANCEIVNKVSEMLAAIQSEGDQAIQAMAQKLDQQPVKEIELLPFDEYQLDSELSEAIQLAAARIERFAEFQKQGLDSRTFEDDYGVFGQKVEPIERVGAYIPGGRYPLISTALMTLIPARVAGSKVRIACSPSDNPALLAAASLAGATKFIQIGGVQAIGALAFGYDNEPAVDIIVGPGNAWVNEAKKQVQGKVKIDGLAGPSELLALCDREQPIEWLALDALAQAEHDPMACSLIVSDDSNWLVSMLSYLENNSTTNKLLKDQQIELIFADSKQQMIDFSQTYAPEHLMLCDPSIDVDLLSNYGSLFIGANSAVALGDYITGPNHTLPTLGYAKQNGGLNVATFLRVLTIQDVNNEGRKLLSKQAALIAEAEGLEFHKASLIART